MTTRNVQVDLFPLPSVAVLVTRLVPKGKRDPEAVLFTTVGTPQLSVAGTLKVTTAMLVPGSVLRVIVAGQVICGASLSVTVTVKLFVTELPLASVARQVTVVNPTGKVEPEA